MGKKYLLYIHDERFAEEAKKSNLVNSLLASHYNQQEPAQEPASEPTPPVGQKVAVHLRPKKDSALRSFDHVCPEHAIPMDWRGKCLQRGCKYGYE